MVFNFYDGDKFMIALREYVKVQDHQLHIQLPNDFNYDEVEVVILSRVAVKPVNHKFGFSDLAGQLEWQGNALCEQQRLRDEWK